MFFSSNFHTTCYYIAAVFMHKPFIYPFCVCVCVVERLLKLFVANDKGDLTLFCDEGNDLLSAINLCMRWQFLCEVRIFPLLQECTLVTETFDFSSPRSLEK